ncbi:hypothetical protein Tco_0371924 [Tanacetum coccineum]
MGNLQLNRPKYNSITLQFTITAVIARPEGLIDKVDVIIGYHKFSRQDSSGHRASVAAKTFSRETAVTARIGISNHIGIGIDMASEHAVDRFLTQLDSTRHLVRAHIARLLATLSPLSHYSEALQITDLFGSGYMSALQIADIPLFGLLQIKTLSSTNSALRDAPHWSNVANNNKQGSFKALEVLYVLDSLKDILLLMSIKFSTKILYYFKSLLALHQSVVSRRILDSLYLLCLQQTVQVSPEAMVDLLSSLAISVSSNEMSGDELTFDSRLLDVRMKKVFSLKCESCIAKLPLIFSALKGLFNIHTCIDTILIKEGVNQIRGGVRKDRLAVIEKLCATVESLLDYSYAAFWDMSFQVVVALFDKLGVSKKLVWRVSLSDAWVTGQGSPYYTVNNRVVAVRSTSVMLPPFCRVRYMIAGCEAHTPCRYAWIMILVGLRGSCSLLSCASYTPRGAVDAWPLWILSGVGLGPIAYCVAWACGPVDTIRPHVPPVYPEGKIGMHTRFIEFANYRIPLSKFLLCVLEYYQIKLSQLSVIGAAKVVVLFEARGADDPCCYSKKFDSLKN